jgi:hypothetical protein
MHLMDPAEVQEGEGNGGDNAHIAIAPTDELVTSANWSQSMPVHGTVQVTAVMQPGVSQASWYS